MNYWLRLAICLAILMFAIPCHAGGPKRTTYTFLRIDRPIVEQRLRTIPSAGWAKEIQKQVQAAHTKSVCEQQVVPDETEPNLICTVPGTGSSTIVISATLDSAEPNRWPSVSMLPLLLESLSAVANSSTYIFAAFTGHDSNNAGANWYLSHLNSAHTKRIKALIALDGLGQNAAMYAGGANSGDLMSWIPNAADALLLPPPSLSPNV